MTHTHIHFQDPVFIGSHTHCNFLQLTRQRTKSQTNEMSLSNL